MKRRGILAFAGMTEIVVWMICLGGKDTPSKLGG
jgi:hypothetical protein